MAGHKKSNISGPLPRSWAGKALEFLPRLGNNVALDRWRTICGYNQKMYAFRASVLRPLLLLDLISHDVEKDTVSLSNKGRIFLRMPTDVNQPDAVLKMPEPGSVRVHNRPYVPPARLLPRPGSLDLLNAPSLHGGARVARKSVLGN